MSHRFSTPKPLRSLAIGEALLATLIWASSFILAQYGKGYISPFTLAGIRYLLAGLIMSPFLFYGQQSILHLPAKVLWRLFWIGLFAHALGNGAFFLAFKYLSATTSTFISCFLPVPILLIGIVQLGEIPTVVQLIGLLVTLGGSALFFSPRMSNDEWIGLGIAIFGIFAFAYSTILSRAVAREQQASTFALTALPLVFGGLPLLGSALVWEGLPTLTPFVWAIIFALAVINTVVAYWLYNNAMQVLTAFEVNIFLNLAPFGTAVLAWYFFGDRLSIAQLIGMVIVIVGITLVQWQPRTVTQPESLAAHSTS